MFESLPGPGAFLAFLSFVGSIALTIIGAILKLCGVLLLSWWWIVGIVPMAIIVIVLIAGVRALIDS